MTNHVKPTLQEVNPDHIILNAGTNDFRTDKTANQIEKATIDLVTSMKSNENLVSVPRLDELKNKAKEVNDRLVQMCRERNVLFLSTPKILIPASI